MSSTPVPMLRADEPTVRDIAVVGAGGHAREVLDIVEAASTAGGWRVIGLLDDTVFRSATMDRRGLTIVSPPAHLARLTCMFVVGLGYSGPRSIALDRLHDLGVDPARVATVSHPAASIAPTATLSGGCVVAAGAVIGAAADLGSHVHVNVNATIGPAVQAGWCASVAPGATVGHKVVLGARSFVGAGSVIHPGVVVGDDALVGAGAVVLDDVEAGTTVVGRPACAR